jgi:hypothetical protein
MQSVIPVAASKSALSFNNMLFVKSFLVLFSSPHSRPIFIMGQF